MCLMSQIASMNASITSVVFFYSGSSIEIRPRARFFRSSDAAVHGDVPMPQVWGIHAPMPIPCSRSRVRLELADASWLATVRCQPRTARRAGDHVGIAMREVAATPEQDG
jgi:hypothetical protein